MKPHASLALATAVTIAASAVIPAAFAQKTPYTDVQAGAYYENAASALLQSGALDPNMTRLRPGELATRAELVKLLVNVHGTPLLYPAVSSFNDVRISDWYFPYFEAAADAGWVRGDRNCYRTFRPCTARPPSGVNRAEAATLLVRAFALARTGRAPDFPDNSRNAWYYENVQIAADHCILQGDDRTGRVRPGSFMNRAEMVVMFHRATQNFRYGTDCGVPLAVAHVTGAEALSSTRIRLIFDQDLDAGRAEQPSRYAIVAVNGSSSIAVRTATLVNSRTVDLSLATALSANVAYRVTAMNLLTRDGVIFSDSAAFTLPGPVGHISSVSTTSAVRVQATFDTDLDTARVEELLRYGITEAGRELPLTRVQLLTNRSVEISLGEALKTQHAYTLNVKGLRTAAGVVFSDSRAFVYDAGSLSFRATLTGAQEVPPVFTGMSGTGTFVLQRDGLHYDVTVRNLSGAITAAHFHRGAAGIAGPVISPITFVGTRSVGVWTDLTNEQRMILLNGNIYVNVHTAKEPNGEIRGQVVP